MKMSGSAAQRLDFKVGLLQNPERNKWCMPRRLWEDERAPQHAQVKLAGVLVPAVSHSYAKFRLERQHRGDEEHAMLVRQNNFSKALQAM